jgi:hypothetical protein
MIQIGELDPNTVIWRYLPFNRFTSLVEFGALWFSRLRAFNDLDEGMTPAVPRTQLRHSEFDPLDKRDSDSSSCK